MLVVRPVPPPLLRSHGTIIDYAAPSGLGSLVESQTRGVATGCIIAPLQGKNRTAHIRPRQRTDLWVRVRVSNPGKARPNILARRAHDRHPRKTRSAGHWTTEVLPHGGRGSVAPRSPYRARIQTNTPPGLESPGNERAPSGREMGAIECGRACIFQSRPPKWDAQDLGNGGG